MDLHSSKQELIQLPKTNWKNRYTIEMSALDKVNIIERNRIWESPIIKVILVFKQVTKQSMIK